MRIISICPSNTELLAYLGLTKQIIAVDDFSDWPVSVQELPRLGPDLSIDMDKVESLKPDLVVASLSVPGMEKNVEQLVKRNIPHIVLNPNSLEEIIEDLIVLGTLTEREAEAQATAVRFREFIDSYQNLAGTIQSKRSVYWEWWPKPVFTPGGVNWLTEISELAGGVNTFADVELASVQTDWEDVKRRDPDIIALAWVGVRTEKINPELVKKRPGWEEMKAVRENEIHILEEDLYCRPSPRLLVGLQKLASILHPDIYPSFDGRDPLLEEL